MTLKITDQKGLTLTELLITTTIVGIMMLGVVAIDHALMQGEQGSSRSTAVTMRVNGMMSHITRNASLAVGHDSNRGICISNPSTTPTSRYHSSCNTNADEDITDSTLITGNNFICIRQNLRVTPLPAVAGPIIDPLSGDLAPCLDDPNVGAGDPCNGMDLETLSNNRWACYTRKQTSSTSSSELFYCVLPYNTNTVTRGVRACINGDAFYTNLGIVANDTFSIVNNVDYTPKFVIDSTLGSQGLYFEVTLRTYYDPTKPLDDRMNNPMMQMTSRVSPDGHGF